MPYLSNITDRIVRRKIVPIYAEFNIQALVQFVKNNLEQDWCRSKIDEKIIRVVDSRPLKFAGVQPDVYSAATKNL